MLMLDRLKKVKSGRIIYESTDYDAFTYLYYNRTIEKPRRDRIAKSISKVGQKDPAIVNPEGKIISGQGRFEACKMLRVPFQYVIEDHSNDKETLECMLEVHKTQTTFTLGESIQVYCDLEYDDYLWFQKTQKEYSLQPQTLIMFIAEGWDNNHSVNDAIKSGDFEISDEQKEQVVHDIKWVLEIDELRPFNTKDRTGARKQVFVKSMLQLFKWGQFDRDRFIDQVSAHRIRIEGDTDLQWDELEFIYNKGLKKTQRITFPDHKVLSKTKRFVTPWVSEA